MRLRPARAAGPVGILANQSMHKAGVLFSDSSDKAARFIWICNAFNVPLLFLADNAGYMIGTEVERAGIIRHGAKMLFAVCEASVPRICVLVARPTAAGTWPCRAAPPPPDAVLALPTAKVALMGPAAAVNAIHYNRIVAIEDPDEREALRRGERAEVRGRHRRVQARVGERLRSGRARARLRQDLIARFAAYAPSTRPTRADAATVSTRYEPRRRGQLQRLLG